MKGRMVLLAAIAVAAMMFSAAPASAAHVQCGDTITTSTTLDSDVVCPAEQQAYGLQIGADNVLLKMNGFALRAGTGGGIVGLRSASPDEDGLQGVRIKRGSIEGFLQGIDLISADDSTVFKVSVTTFDPFPFAGDGGIWLTGDRNWLEQNTVTLTGDEGDGIRLTGDDPYAWGNVVTANTVGGFAHRGVVAFGERPRLVYNRVTGCGTPGAGGAGVSASGYTGQAVINRNIVSGCDVGVESQVAVENPGGALVRLNQTTGGVIGIRVGDPGAIVGRNVARDATDIGILSDLAGTTVRNNEAYDNGNYGISAAPGTVDGGGNVASGNGDGSTPQCVNVACSEPPPPT